MRAFHNLWYRQQDMEGPEAQQALQEYVAAAAQAAKQMLQVGCCSYSNVRLQLPLATACLCWLHVAVLHNVMRVDSTSHEAITLDTQ